MPHSKRHLQRFAAMSALLSTTSANAMVEMTKRSTKELAKFSEIGTAFETKFPGKRSTLTITRSSDNFEKTTWCADSENFLDCWDIFDQERNGAGGGAGWFLKYKGGCLNDKKIAVAYSEATGVQLSFAGSAGDFNKEGPDTEKESISYYDCRDKDSDTEGNDWRIQASANEDDKEKGRGEILKAWITVSRKDDQSEKYVEVAHMDLIRAKFERNYATRYLAAPYFKETFVDVDLSSNKGATGDNLQSDESRDLVKIIDYVSGAYAIYRPNGTLVSQHLEDVREAKEEIKKFKQMEKREDDHGN